MRKEGGGGVREKSVHVRLNTEERETHARARAWQEKRNSERTEKKNNRNELGAIRIAR